MPLRFDRGKWTGREIRCGEERSDGAPSCMHAVSLSQRAGRGQRLQSAASKSSSETSPLVTVPASSISKDTLGSDGQRCFANTATSLGKRMFKPGGATLLSNFVPLMETRGRARNDSGLQHDQEHLDVGLRTTDHEADKIRIRAGQLAGPHDGNGLLAAPWIRRSNQPPVADASAGQQALCSGRKTGEVAVRGERGSRSIAAGPSESSIVRHWEMSVAARAGVAAPTCEPSQSRCSALNPAKRRDQARTGSLSCATRGATRYGRA